MITLPRLSPSRPWLSPLLKVTPGFRKLSVSQPCKMRVIPVPVRKDNYAYLLVDEPSNQAAAVDPFDVPKIVAEAERLDIQIVAAITTHHHPDHSGGNKKFSAAYPAAPIYGGSKKVSALTKLVKDKDEFTLGDNIHIQCRATPCHTKDSICFYATDSANKLQPGVVFTGDTLFIAGCGRFFEGTAADMDAALTYLATLPDDTIVYNGHEYTSENVAFAKTVDPKNEAIARLENIVKQNEITTGLTTIGDEKQWNVFMRADSDSVRHATAATAETPKSAVLDVLRDRKNNFKL